MSLFCDIRIEDTKALVEEGSTMHFPDASSSRPPTPERESPGNPGDYVSPAASSSPDSIHHSPQVSPSEYYGNHYGHDFGPQHRQRYGLSYPQRYGYSPPPIAYPQVPGQPERGVQLSRKADVQELPLPWKGKHIRDTLPSDCKTLGDAMRQDNVERLKSLIDDIPFIDGYLASRTNPAPNNHYFTATEANIPVGVVDFARPRASKDANIAYWFMPNNKRSKGLATHAVAEAVTRVFEKDPTLDRIFCYINKKNEASKRLITREKIAFNSATTAQWQNGVGRSDVDPNTNNLYVISRAEWEARHTRGET